MIGDRCRDESAVAEFRKYAFECWRGEEFSFEIAVVCYSEIMQPTEGVVGVVVPIRDAKYSDNWRGICNCDGLKEVWAHSGDDCLNLRANSWLPEAPVSVAFDKQNAACWMRGPSHLDLSDDFSGALRNRGRHGHLLRQRDHEFGAFSGDEDLVGCKEDVEAKSLHDLKYVWKELLLPVDVKREFGFVY